MAARLACVVPGCRCTRGLRKGEDRLPSEWICGRHYPLVDKRLRRLRTRVKRRTGKRGWTASLEALDIRLWVLAKRQAIERAMGIG